MNLITIYASSDLQEVYYVKSLLEAQGIASSILDENISTIAPHFTFAHGIRLAVNEEDAAKAQELIKDDSIHNKE